ncbi:coenzyme F420-0:L-glutamate ligase [Streptomyces sp. NPDC093252]|uniref:coenzyme F420-0:L-glutamate ligase n=1 Tax=Streptomyces sp. NPDC093252 TaxID=3154980 RepID=UPI0034156DB0
MTTTPTSGVSAFALEPFPEIQPGDDLAGTITDVLSRTGTELRDGDVVVVASKVAGARGPIIARHRLGFELTSAGVDREGRTAHGCCSAIRTPPPAACATRPPRQPARTSQW